MIPNAGEAAGQAVNASGDAPRAEQQMDMLRRCIRVWRMLETPCCESSVSGGIRDDPGAAEQIAGVRRSPVALAEKEGITLGLEKSTLLLHWNRSGSGENSGGDQSSPNFRIVDPGNAFMPARNSSRRI